MTIFISFTLLIHLGRGGRIYIPVTDSLPHTFLSFNLVILSFAKRRYRRSYIWSWRFFVSFFVSFHIFGVSQKFGVTQNSSEARPSSTYLFRLSLFLPKDSGPNEDRGESRSYLLFLS